MKREDVKAKIPEITDEQLDWLMNEHGQDVTREQGKLADLQSKVDDLTGQLNTAKDGLKAFEGVDVDDLRGKIEKLQGDLQAQADAFAFDSALDGAIREAKGRDVKAIRGMLDLEALKASKDRSSDIKEALSNLAKEKAWAFDTGEVRVSTGGEHGTGGETGSQTFADEIASALFPDRQTQ